MESKVSSRTIRQPGFCFGLTLAIVGLAGFLAGQTVPGYSRAEAEKVLKAIDQIEGEVSITPSSPGRCLSLTESELNSYIAFLIESEKEEIMKELRIKVLDQNRLEGKAGIDLSGRDIPSFLKPKMTLYFSADLIVRDAMARLEFIELYLEEQKIMPFILDGVISLVARFSGDEPLDLRRGFELPYGIKDIRTSKGTAVFYY